MRLMERVNGAWRNPEFVEEAIIRGALSQRMLDRIVGKDDG